MWAIAIGVGNIGNDQLDSKLWRGTSARMLYFYCSEQLWGGNRQQLRGLLEVVARQSVPQAGPTMLLATLLRRGWHLRTVGGLRTLHYLLPSFPKLKNGLWRRWLAEHYLMIRDDSAACDIVASEITQTLEPFWHDQCDLSGGSR